MKESTKVLVPPKAALKPPPSERPDGAGDDDVDDAGCAAGGAADGAADARAAAGARAGGRKRGVVAHSHTGDLAGCHHDRCTPAAALEPHATHPGKDPRAKTEFKLSPKFLSL